MDTFSRTISRVSMAGSSTVSLPGRTSRAPWHSAVNTSRTETSKQAVAYCSITSSAVKPTKSLVAITMFVSERCEIITPLGRPVEPEV
jgi:hypothetical protein